MSNHDRLAHEVHVVYASDPQDGGPEPGLYIDGIRFPYFVSQDIETEHGKNSFPLVRIEVFAANLKVTDDHGLIRHQATATPAQESEWAKRRANEIVWEGMGEIIEWLSRAEYEREQKELLAERDEKVWATQAYLNLAALSETDGAVLRADLAETIEAFLEQAPEDVREVATSIRQEQAS